MEFLKDKEISDAEITAASANIKRMKGLAKKKAKGGVVKLKEGGFAVGDKGYGAAAAAKAKAAKVAGEKEITNVRKKRTAAVKKASVAAKKAAKTRATKKAAAAVKTASAKAADKTAAQKAKDLQGKTARKKVRSAAVKGIILATGAGLGGKALYDKAKSAKSYSVKSGDTLSQIAKRRGVTLKDILAANKGIKDPNKIKAGQKIKLPSMYAKPGKPKSPYEGMTKAEMAKMAMKSKSGGAVKKAGGGKMSHVALYPAEEARSGTLSEAKRKRYAKTGGVVKRKAGGLIKKQRGGPFEQGYDDRKRESIAMRRRHPRTAAQLQASADESYGKWGHGKGRGVINVATGGPIGDALVALAYGGIVKKSK